MSKMFENYNDIDTYYAPDNRHRFCFVDKSDEIVIGGVAIHIFKLNFKYSELCEDFEVFYKQSITSILSKHSQSDGISISEFDNFTVIEVTLDQYETARFKAYRDTFAQIKLYMKDGTVHFGEQNKIRMISTLDLSDSNIQEGDLDNMSAIQNVELNGTRLVFKDEDGTTKFSVNLNPLVADQVKSASLVNKEIEFYKSNGEKAFGIKLESLIDMARTGLQEKLVSGQNIKTINNESILGAGNLDVITDLSDYYNKEATDELVSEKVDKVSGKSLIDDSELERLANIDNYDDSDVKESIESLNDKTNIKYKKLSNVSLNEILEPGIYEISNASDVPSDTATNGTLQVKKLVGAEKVEQEWLSATNSAHRLYTISDDSLSFYVNGVKTSSSVVTLDANGAYELSGDLKGCVEIIGTALEPTKLILNGVNIWSEKAYGIATVNDNPVVIQLAENSENYIIVEDNETPEGEPSSYGAIFANKDLTIIGPGYLSVSNTKGHGLKGADLSIIGYAHVYADAEHDAFHGKSFKATDSYMYVKNGNDAFSAGNDTNDGSLTVINSEITVEKCRENVFQSRTKAEASTGSYINIYNTKIDLKPEFSTKPVCEATKVNVYDNCEVSGAELQLKSLKEAVGPARLYNIDDGEEVDVSGNNIALNKQSYWLSGDITGKTFTFNIKSANLELRGVYSDDKSTGGDYIFGYIPDGKRLEINAAANTINYIKSEGGLGCLYSGKNIGLKGKGAIIIEAPNSYGIYTIGGAARLMGDGYISIQNSKYGILSQCVDLGEDHEKIEIDGELSSGMTELTSTHSVAIKVIGNEEYDIYTPTRMGSSGEASGEVVASPTHFGCSVIGKVIDNNGETEGAAHLADKPGKIRAYNHEKLQYIPVLMCEENEIQQLNTLNVDFASINNDIKAELPEQPVAESNDWKVYKASDDCYTKEEVESGYVAKADYENVVKQLAALTPKVATFDFEESNITATNINIYKHAEDTKPHTVKYYIDEEENIYARNSEDGCIMTDGTGSICLSPAGLAENEVLSASIEGSYNKFKTPYTTLVDGMYKITKPVENISVKLNKISEADLEAWTVTYNITLPENYAGNAPTVTEYRCNDAMVAGFMGKQLVFEDNKCVSKSYSKETGYPDKTTDDAAQINFKVEAELPEGYTMSVAIPVKTYKNFTKTDNTYQATKLKGNTTVNITIAPPVTVTYNAGDYGFSTTATEIPSSVGLGSDLVFAFYHQTNKANPTKNAECVPDGAAGQLPTAEACLNRIASITIGGNNYTVDAANVEVGGKKATVKIPGTKVTGNVAITLK